MSSDFHHVNFAARREWILIVMTATPTKEVLELEISQLEETLKSLQAQRKETESKLK